jgi:hypothetical protein
MIALGHGVGGSNHLEKAKASYDALLGSVGMAWGEPRFSTEDGK